MNTIHTMPFIDRFAAKTFRLLKVLAFLCAVFAIVALFTGAWGAAFQALKAAAYCLVPVVAPGVFAKLFSR